VQLGLHLYANPHGKEFHFLDTLDVQDGSIYKLNKKLLNKTPAVHPLIGPNGLMYKDEEKV